MSFVGDAEMRSVEALKNRKRRLRTRESNANKPPEVHATSSIRIEALKELTRTLVEEVESLENVQRQVSKNGISLYKEVQRFEIDLIRWALMRTGGHQRRAAQLLGIKITTLNAKIKRYQIRTDEIISSLVNLHLNAKANSIGRP